MAYIPECGTLGYNRGRPDNEPLSEGERTAIEAHEYLWGKPGRISDDPRLKMQATQMTAGAWALGVGIIAIAAIVVGRLM